MRMNKRRYRTRFPKTQWTLFEVSLTYGFRFEDYCATPLIYLLTLCDRKDELVP